MISFRSRVRTLNVCSPLTTSRTLNVLTSLLTSIIKFVGGSKEVRSVFVNLTFLGLFMISFRSRVRTLNVCSVALLQPLVL